MRMIQTEEPSYEYEKLNKEAPPIQAWPVGDIGREDVPSWIEDMRPLHISDDETRPNEYTIYTRYGYINASTDDYIIWELGMNTLLGREEPVLYKMDKTSFARLYGKVG